MSSSDVVSPVGSSSSSIGGSPLLLQLPEDLLTEVLAFADRRSVGCMSATHRAVRAAIRGNDYLWQELVQRDWPGVAAGVAGGAEEPPGPTNGEQPREEDTSERTYQRLATKFGRTAHCFARTSDVWVRLTAFLRAHASELPSSMLANLSGGCASIGAVDAAVTNARAKWKNLQVTTRRAMRAELVAEGVLPRKPTAAASEGDAEMHSSSSAAAAAAASVEMDFETAIGLPPLEEPSNVDADTQEVDGLRLRDLQLPDELVCSLLFHNGQTDMRSGADAFTGVLGGFSFYSFGANFHMASLQEMLLGTQKFATLLLQARQREARDRRKANKRRKSTGAQPTNVDTLQDTAAAATATAAVATSSDDGIADSSSVDDLVASVDLLVPLTSNPIGPEQVQFFLRLADGSIVRRRQDGVSVLVAPSYLDWLERYVSDLEAGMFGLSPRDGINRFPQADPCASDTTTNGVRIQCSVLYVPEQSRAQHHFFAYRVRMTLASGGPPTRATLVSRHWVIEDADGKVEHVDGPGVIGLYPSIFPGCEPFTYESCCPIATATGRMRGAFRFQDDRTDQAFDALIQPFGFDAQRNYV